MFLSLVEAGALSSIQCLQLSGYPPNLTSVCMYMCAFDHQVQEQIYRSVRSL